MKKKRLIAAIEKVAHGYGCCGTKDGDLICEALRKVVAELEKPDSEINRLTTR